MDVKKSKLGNLIQLQELDLVRDNILARLKEIPRLIEEQNNEASTLKEEIIHTRKSLKQIQNDLKSRELDLTDAQNFIVKHKEKLNMLKSNLAYRKMQKEIKNKEKEIDNKESDIIIFYEKIEDIEKTIRDLEKKLNQKKEQIKEVQEELRREEKNLRKNLSEIEDNIEPYRKDIPNSILSKYDKIKSQKSKALVKVENMSCTGCHSQLPPQKINEAKSPKKLPRCESCYRFIYVEKK